MVIHKITIGNEKTACGLDVFLNEIEVSRDWKDVTCKNCKKTRKTDSLEK